LTKPNWFSLSVDQQDELGLVVPSSHWRIIAQGSLPREIRAKVDSKK